MKFPTGDIFLMIVSVFLAVLLWTWMGAEERAEVIVSVPLEYRNLQRGMEITSPGDVLSKVNVWVKGNTANIKNLRPEEVSVWLDLADVQPGEKMMELTTDNVKVPYGFSVLRISPSRVHLKIEKVVQKTVPVVPRLQGSLTEGFKIAETTASPAQAEIIGPQSAIHRIDRVVTDPIDISSLTGNYTQKVRIGVEDSAVRLGNVREVMVVIRVTEVTDRLTVRGIPVKLIGTTRVVRFQPKTVRVEFEAPRSQLARIPTDKIEGIVDLAGLPPGVYDVTPRISFPGQTPKISVIHVTPERIHVRIQ